MSEALKVFFLVIGVISIVATALPLIKEEWWWIRMFDFPRLQIIVLDIAAISGFAYLIDRSDVFEMVFMGLLAASAV